MLFLAREHHLHRRARGFRETRRHDDLAIEAELAAEAAAHVVRDHADVVLRDCRALSRCRPARRAPPASRPTPSACRLPIRRRRRVSRGWCASAPASSTALRRCDVALASPSSTLPSTRSETWLTLPFGNTAGRLRPHGLFDGRQVRQHLVVDLDQPDRVFRGFLRRRRDGRDLFALVAHLRGFAGGGIDQAQRRADARAPSLRLAESIDRMRACGCGDPSSRPKSMPGRLMSYAYFAEPWVFAGPSRRLMDLPRSERSATGGQLATTHRLSVCCGGSTSTSARVAPAVPSAASSTRT